MYTLATIVDNQDALLIRMKQALLKRNWFTSDFPTFVMQPPTVVSDSIVELLFEQAYLGCHVASRRLPCLAPLRATIKQEHRGSSISLDFSTMDMNYRMMHRCRIMETDLVRYKAEYEFLRNEIAAFAQLLLELGFVRYLPRHPIEYELDSEMWSKVYLEYEALLWRANDLAVSMEECILNIPDRSLVIQATRILEKLMPYRKLLDVLEQQTLGRKHGGYVIAQDNHLRLKMHRFYGSSVFVDFSDDLSALHPSTQSLRTVGSKADRSHSDSAVGGCAMHWNEHSVVAAPIEGIVQEIQDAIDADEEMRRFTEEMDLTHWSLDGALVLQARANPIISRVVRERLSGIMERRIVGFHFDFEFDRFHRVTTIKWSPVITMSACKRSKPEHVQNYTCATFDHVVIEVPVHS